MTATEGCWKLGPQIWGIDNNSRGGTMGGAVGAGEVEVMGWRGGQDLIDY